MKGAFYHEEKDYYTAFRDGIGHGFAQWRVCGGIYGFDRYTQQSDYLH